MQLPPLLAAASLRDATPTLQRPTEGEDIVADYAHLGLTLRRHPLALLRSRLSALRVVGSDRLRTLPQGRSVTVASIVTCRQRPDIASGVTFVTLEDEYGWINVVVWRDLAEKQHRELVSTRLLGVRGRVERQGEVIHVIAARLFDYSGLLGELRARSRDFR